MANLILAKAIFPVSVAGAAGGETGLANLYTADPKEAASFTVSDNLSFDLGANYDVDTLLLGFIGGGGTLSHTGSFFKTTTLGGGTTTAFSGAMTFPASGVSPRHGLFKASAAQNMRYGLISGITVTSAWTLGILAVGKSIQPTYGHEWGAGRSVDDRSFKESLMSGGFGIQKNAVVPAWQFTVADLTNADLALMWDLVRDVGMSSPVIVVEDPAAAQPALTLGIHYGLFDKPEAYERTLPGASKWSFRVQEWN